MIWFDDLISKWSEEEPTIIELLQLWLDEHAPGWSVFFGAYITIAPSDEMKRWESDKHIYVGRDSVSIEERQLNLGCKPSHRWTTTTLLIADPEFFNKLKVHLT